MKKGSGTQSITKLCEICKKPFSSFICAKRKFCSSECAYKGRIMHKKQVEYKCTTCGKSVFRAPCQVMLNVFCSRKCSQSFQTDKPGLGGRERNPEKRKTLTCKLCGKPFERFSCAIIPGKDVFCSHSCHTKFANQYKRGCKSKLEKWLAIELNKQDIPVFMNDRKLLKGYELDIYFPTKNLAFEIDGPWHRLPLNGEKVFNKIQYNDKFKNQRCNELGIRLIRIQNEKSFTEQIGNEVLAQILQHLN